MPPALARIAAALPDTVPFVAPEAIERRLGQRFRARLGANESGFGPSPKVVDAIRSAAAEAWMYCDPEMFDLRQAIAARAGVAPRNVAIGEGIDGIMGNIARLWLDPGDVVVTSRGAYPTFIYHAVGFGGRMVYADYRDDREDLDALLDLARRERARIVYLCNPDNPMGSWWPANEVAAFIEALPEQTMLILDEAYGETAPEGVLPPLAPERPNVLRLRTFSKAYGLAGQRVGYAIGEPGNVRAFDRVRNHFGVNRLGQVAALAALDDPAYLDRVVGDISAARDRIAAIAGDSGLVALPSATNFVAIDCGRDGDFALAVLRALEALGVFVRKPMVPPLDRCIRISAAPAAELDVLAECLPLALERVRAHLPGTSQ